MIHLIQQTILKGEEYNQDVGKNNIFNAGRKGKLVKDKKKAKMMLLICRKDGVMRGVREDYRIFTHSTILSARFLYLKNIDR